MVIRRQHRFHSKPGGWLLLATLLGCGGGNEYVPPPPPNVTVAKPTRLDFTDYHIFTGRLEAVASVEIRARVEGFLQEARFEEGDFVTEGDVLCIIDPSEYVARVASAQAAVAQAKAGLDIAEATLQRKEKALETNAVSVLDVLQAKAERDGADAQVKASDADLVSANLRLEWTTVKAPMSGVIGLLLVDEGNLVGAGENTLLTSIVQYDPIYATFDMSERDLLEIIGSRKERDPNADRVKRMRALKLELGLSNEQGYSHAGFVHYVDQGIDPETGTLLMLGSFPNPRPHNLFPGLFVRVRTPLETRDVLAISERALGTNQSGRYVLVVDSDNVVQPRQVVVGGKVEGGLSVIEEGIAATDSIIVNGVLRARPGAKVNPEMAKAASPDSES